MNEESSNKPYCVLNFSGGKDSTALLILLLENGEPLDEIIFCDTGYEMPQLYDHIDDVEAWMKANYPDAPGITRLKPENGFDYYLYEKPIIKGSRKGKIGYGWPSMRNRWCTKYLKLMPKIRHLRGRENVVHYVGIAADEPKRIRNDHDKRYPLAEWGITESECLELCYSKGFTFQGLYKHFKRLGCWCCPLKSKHDLRVMWKYYPTLWKRLLEMEEKSRRGNPDRFFQHGRTVAELDAKFRAEGENMA